MITVVNHDVSTAEGWRHHLEHWRGAVGDRAREKELNHASLVMTITHDWKTGQPLTQLHDLLLIGIFVGDDDDAVEETKRKFANAARMFGVAARCVGQIFFSEAWIAYARKGDKTLPRPSKSPDRQEVLMAYGEHRDFGQEFRYAKIIAGPPRKVGPWEDPGVMAETRFHCILPRRAEAAADFPRFEAMAREVLFEYEKPGGFLHELARSAPRVHG